MNYQFFIQGIHGKHCTDKVTELLKHALQAEDIKFNTDNSQIQFSSNTPINVEELNQLLATSGNYTVSNKLASNMEDDNPEVVSYKPIYIILGYLLVVNLSISWQNLQLETFMTNFMASFFLVFSFFKVLDLRGFADGYSSYDVVARKFYYYGYVYPFLELGFGLGYLLIGRSIYLNIAVFIVMLISSIGVIKSKLSKQKFYCACVGTFLKVPLGSIAIIEDVSMVIMSFFMIIHLTAF